MIWILFILLIIGLLALDLGVFHRKEEVVSMKQSLIWTLIWITVSLLFGIAIYYIYEFNFMNINHQNIPAGEALLNYYTGYVIEKTLSLDNIFVIALIFTYFKIGKKYQHNILFWGILGAIVFRGIMIWLGAAFINKFSWSTYVLGGILIYSTIHMLISKQEETDFTKNFILRQLSKIYPIKWEMHTDKYFITENGKKFITASFAALIVVEFTDVLFAVDSIPAILAITTDPFIVFTSNIFAILGLRTLYFFLAGMLDKFQYMKYSLVFILILVGIKMMLVHYYKFPTAVSLSLILGALAIGIFASMLNTKKA